MGQNIQILVGIAAIAVSAAAQTDMPATASNIADTASIILAPGSCPSIQKIPPEPGMGKQPFPTAAKEGSIGNPAGSEDATSRHISRMIFAGLPKFDPSPTATDLAVAGSKSDGKPLQSNPGVALLPAFIVRDTKVPNEGQILTSKAQANIAMDKYLGPSDGFDRGVLNRYTLKQLWQKIPILPGFLSIFGGLQFVGTVGSLSNEDRAYDAGGANDTIPYPHPPPKAKDGSDE
jgi:hypothetical protein